MGAAAFGELPAEGEWIDPQRLATLMPAGSGITNGRGLARIGSVVASGGEVGGRRYLSREIVTEAGREQSFKHDEVLGPLRLGLGFGLDSDGFPAPTPTTMHWGGLGGSFLTMDPASGLACGYAPNQLVIGESPGDDPRLATYWRLLGEISNELA